VFLNSENPCSSRQFRPTLICSDIEVDRGIVTARLFVLSYDDPIKSQDLAMVICHEGFAGYEVFRGALHPLNHGMFPIIPMIRTGRAVYLAIECSKGIIFCILGFSVSHVGGGARDGCLRRSRGVGANSVW